MLASKDGGRPSLKQTIHHVGSPNSLSRLIYPALELLHSLKILAKTSSRSNAITVQDSGMGKVSESDSKILNRFAKESKDPL